MMTRTKLIAEFLVIGSLFILGATLIFGVPLELGLYSPEGNVAIVLAFLGAIAYLIGFFANAIAEIIFKPIYPLIEQRWMNRRGTPKIPSDEVRYDLYVSAPIQVINRLEYHRTLIRLSRSTVIVSLIFGISALVMSQFAHAGAALGIATIGCFSYYRRVVWFTKSTYMSRGAQRRRDRVSQFLEAQTKELPDSRIDEEVFVFAGGTAFREINIELTKYVRHITRVVPVWDNGGSSKILRQHFGVMPIGDVRHVLMTMAHGEGKEGDIVRLLNWRMPDDVTIDLGMVLQQFVEGHHALISCIEPSLLNVITGYLKVFYREWEKDKFDLRQGSIGNFVLVGAYLSHNSDINTAIYVFRQLCKIEGHVWPVSLQNNLHLAATFKEAPSIEGQENITNIDRGINRDKIIDVYSYENGKPETPSPVSANELVLEEIKRASVIVFGPGSFFTSVLPHLSVAGIADALAECDVPKIFIGNITESSETFKYSLDKLIKLFLSHARKNASVRRAPHKYLTHILVNDNNNQKHVPGGKRLYLPPGENINRYGKKITLITDNFESPWRRGEHDPKRVSKLIAELCVRR